MQHIRLTALLAILSVGFFSCKKDSSSTACTNTTNWLKNGHQLVYTFSSPYVFADSLTADISEVTSGIFKNTSTYDDGTLYSPVSVYVQPCGNSIFQSSVSAMTDKQEVYRLDGNVGDTWTVTSQSTGGQTVTTTFTIAAKNVSVTVPAGTFSCLQIHSVSVAVVSGVSNSITNETYLDSHFGPVKVDGTTAQYGLARANF